MNTMNKKQFQIIMPMLTAKQIIKAEKLQQKLYNKFDHVVIKWHGFEKVEIVAY